ncbi:MAG TPA: DUF5655 domain-containing protein [Acidimicrobiales bacterium]|nr:DUF5655 domain-containing protein [Acidimicrobiales bacterium]
MTVWTCPNCGRDFGARGQGHDCRPGLTIDEYAARALPFFRPIYDRIEARLRPLDGDLIIDPIDKMVLFKHGGTFATVTSMTKWVAIGFSLRRKLSSDRLSRKVGEYGSKYHHVVNLTDPDEVDDELLEWLEEAFHASVGRAPHPDGEDGDMVPDDVDVDIM